MAMKILHINTHIDGGAGRVCSALHGQLLEQSVDSSMLVVTRINHTGLPILRIHNTVKGKISRVFLEFKELLYKIRYSYVRSRLPSTAAWFSFPWAPYDITSTQAYKEADIIHLHWVGELLDYKRFFRKNSKPIVWTLHDLNPLTGGHHNETGFPKTAYSELSKKFLALKEKAFSNQTIHWIPVSSVQEEQAKGYKLFHQFPKELIHNGVYTSIFKPHDKRIVREVLDLAQDKTLVFFINYSDAYELKGMKIMRETMNLLKGKDVQFITIGLEDVSAHPNCLSLGGVNDARLMSQLYSAADVYVCPSIEESFGLTVLESLSCGTPVVGFGIGCLPEVIKNGENGWICPEKTASSLANGIQQILENPCTQSREAIRKPIEENYSWEVITKKYLKLYQVILAGKAPS